MCVDHYKLCFRLGHSLGNFCNFTRTNERCWFWFCEGRYQRINNIQINGFRQTNGFRQLALRIPVRCFGFSPSFSFNVNDNRPGEFWAFNLEIYAGT